jgi:hypothetical protein
MALSNLRPDLTITQKFVNPNPIVPATNLPVLLIGLNRALNYRLTADVGTYNGGSAVTAALFPNYVSGIIESASATDVELRPTVYISGEYGVAEITSQATFNGLSGGSPDFDLPAGVDAVFEIGSGSTGAFAVNTSTPLVSSYIDNSADFIVDQVGPGDEILINGIPTFAVSSPVGIVSDVQLNVRRLDKGPSTAGAAEAAKVLISAEDVNDVRTLTATSVGFSDAGGFVNTGVGVGDLVRLDYWNVEEQGSGITYLSIGETAANVGAYVVPATERVVTLPDASFTASPWDNTNFVGGMVFTADEASEFRPAFYTTSAVDTLRVAVKDFATNHLADTEDADFGVVYKAYEYVLRTSPSVFGAFGVATTVSNEVRRAFSDSALIASPGFFTSPGAGGATIGDHILVKDTDNTYRPLFEVIGYGSDVASPSGDSPDSDGIIVVKQFGGDIVLPTLSASNVDYLVMNPGSPSVYLGASVGAAGTGTVNAVALSPDERLVTASSPYDFGSADNGDLVFSDTGTLMFTVTRAGTGADNEKLVVKDHPNRGTVFTSPDTISAFGFSVRSSLRSDFTVKRVVGADSLELTQLTTTPNVIPGTRSIKGAIYFQQAVDLSATPENQGTWPALVTTGDSAANLSYTIEKTVSGAALEGDILVTYAEVLDANTATIIEVSGATSSALLGPAVPGNPLALASQVALANTGTSIFTLQVAEDTVASWTAALSTAEVDTIYSLAPLTQREDVLTLMRAHVATQSLPANKRERIGYQSHDFERTENRTSLADGDLPTLSRTAGGVTTVVINRDVETTPGTIVGDSVTGTYFDGTALTAFSGSITILSTVGAVSTLTITADGNVAFSVVDLVVTAYSIDSKTLTDAQLKDVAVAYTAGVASRRIRNIFPDTYGINFTDTTSVADPSNEGFYGGGDVLDAAVGGEYVCAMEAAKRANFGPSRPLTRLNGAGINSITDPFTGNPTLQDALIDAGHYYMEQPGGTGAGVQAIRALTTDTAVDLNFAEDIVTTQVDSFSRKLRQVLRPILGAYLIDEGFFNIVSTVQGGVVKDVLDRKEMRTAVLTNISEDPDVPDTFILEYEVTPYFSGARGQVTIFI